MDTPATYLQFGFVLISIPNLALIIGMIAVFVIALLAPFPHDGGQSDREGRGHE